MYASNNGPDHLGYEQPPEYFSRVTAGSFHGMPWFQFDGKQLKRDNCVSSQPPRPLADVATPVATFPARNAPMGVAFVPKGSLNKALEIRCHRGAARVLGHQAQRQLRWATAPRAVRPSWSRCDSRTVRPCASMISLRGFNLRDGERWARPVGVAIGPDGALYFTSDSGTNGLFRLRTKKAEQN